MDGKKSKIPYFILLFFAVFITVDMIYIYLAKKTWTGIVTENSYQKGLDYNETLELVKKQKKLGWQLTSEVKDLGKNIRLIKFTLKDKRGNYIKDANLEILFKRPIREDHDFRVKAASIGKAYEVKVSFPLTGRWQAQITVTRGGQSYRKVEEFMMPN